MPAAIDPFNAHLRFSGEQEVYASTYGQDIGPDASTSAVLDIQEAHIIARV